MPRSLRLRRAPPGEASEGLRSGRGLGPTPRAWPRSGGARRKTCRGERERLAHHSHETQTIRTSTVPADSVAVKYFAELRSVLDHVRSHGRRGGRAGDAEIAHGRAPEEARSLACPADDRPAIRRVGV